MTTAPARFSAHRSSPAHVIRPFENSSTLLTRSQLVFYVKTYLKQSFPTPGESFFDIDWFLSHGLSPLLFVFLVHCESRDTFA